MKITQKYTKLSFLCCAMIFILNSCSKMDEYKQFTEKGEISYTGKIDSVTVYSGENRVLIKGLFKSDPKVTRCRIFWNNKRDSLDIPVTKTDKVDTLKQYITLPENLYNFQIYTYDKLGNKSVPIYATGRVYGNSYQESIKNRLIISSIITDQNEVKINWRDIDKTLGAQATIVEYVDIDNKTQKVKIPIEEKSSVLKNFKTGTNFEYKTLYLPDTLSIDTFNTVVVENSPSKKIDRSTWTTSADSFEPTGQLPNGGSPNFVLDGNINTYWHTRHVGSTSPFPHWLAFDMKKKIKVEMIELISRSDHFNADFKDFRIEGRNSEEDPWVTYGTFNLAETTNAQHFVLFSSPELRYIRVYQINGASTVHSHLAEFAVYGKE